MSRPTSARLLIRGGRLLTMDPDLGDLARADILVDHGRIAEIEPDLGEVPGAEVIDATGRIVIPGFVDTHRHMWQAALRQIAPDHTLSDYFRDVRGLLAPQIRPEDAYLGNLLSALGALDAGVTTVQDIANLQGGPQHTDALVQALKDSGARSVFAYGTTGAGAGLSRDAVRVRRQLLPDQDALVTMALCVDSPQPQTVHQNTVLAQELGLLTAMHMNQPASARPVSTLARLGAIPPGTLFIHGNRLDAAELQVIADSGGALSISPAIELMMGHGLPPITLAARLGVPASLSVDVEVAAASDMFTQMRAAFQSARYAYYQDPEPHNDLPTVRQILELATLQGARALGLADRIGSLTPGKQADLVLLRTDRPGVAPAHDPYGTVVLGMDRADVETVLVAGTPVKRHGELLHPGLAELTEAAHRLRESLSL
ncbi:amidohydrolase family protein [Kitasatospora kifunensis]|uniref:Cytosine/adenosine deaminase-related metal-dependent hydrolase n=1 Tax=Kitasatospora kifunensis TaxID=58351 RepID=A0A7W7QXG0_KITKI|nr:amidohydrolase family protein [Kitasatospora kifunensis]MBB4921562.1 cytosine/adenosine deaminase-related metal-dependent hydrolase [Kitasatospora kifunensis]